MGLRLWKAGGAARNGMSTPLLIHANTSLLARALAQNPALDRTLACSPQLLKAAFGTLVYAGCHDVGGYSK